MEQKSWRERERSENEREKKSMNDGCQKSNEEEKCASHPLVTDIE